MASLEQVLLEVDQRLIALGEDPNSALRKQIGEALIAENIAKPVHADILAEMGFDVLFGPHPGKPDWQPEASQFQNLCNDFEQTHEEIVVRKVAGVKKGPNTYDGNAIIGRPKAEIAEGVLHTCPRRIEDGRGPGSPFVGSDKGDVWGKDRTCSYCGSMHPDDFMVGVADGSIECGPTDKNYKVYTSGEGANGRLKFYFQHLSGEQRRQFVDLINGGAIKIGEPGYFYRRPFFCVPVIEATTEGFLVDA